MTLSLCSDQPKEVPMIRLTSAKQALSLRGKIPELAVLRMTQFEGSDCQKKAIGVRSPNIKKWW